MEIQPSQLPSTALEIVIVFMELRCTITLCKNPNKIINEVKLTYEEINEILMENNEDNKVFTENFKNT